MLRLLDDLQQIFGGLSHSLSSIQPCRGRSHIDQIVASGLVCLIRADSLVHSGAREPVVLAEVGYGDV